MGKKDLKSPDLFINRELSWLEFNDRVLQEGRSETVPLGERLKFLSIVSSNLDEFFMIRVAGLKQQKAAGVRKRDPSGLTPSQQLLFISGKVHEMVTQQAVAIADALAELKPYGFHLVRRQDWTPTQRQFLAGFFASEVLPVLTPLAVQDLDPCPLLPGLQLFVAVLVSASRTNPSPQKLVVIPVPGSLPRFVNIPAEQGVYVAPLEEIILDNARAMFGGCRIGREAVFRITRDADVAIQEDEAADLLSMVRDAVHARKHRGVVRLEISARPDPRIRQWLSSTLRLLHHDIYEIDGLLDARALMQLIDIPPVQGLRAGDWFPQEPADLIGAEELWPAIRERDVMLFHPYERFDPVIEMVQNAADDPAVLAIKQTLYRTSGDSPIIDALIEAAEAGKQVLVLVEIKARFDEQANIAWARKLERSGCHVVYGMLGLKTHCKLSMVVRDEPEGLRRYVHIGTGNYNPKTARMYEDMGLLTSSTVISEDVAKLFNHLSGMSQETRYKRLLVAPHGVRRGLLENIDTEILNHKRGLPARIRIKVNSIVDEAVTDALYRASQAGVPVDLWVRGICSVRPGIPGLSENIRVRSILGRFLEHSRLFWFANNGQPLVGIGSSDLMHRNLDRRVEVLVALTNPRHIAQVEHLFDLAFSDGTASWWLEGNTWTQRTADADGTPLLDIQEHLIAQVSQRRAERAETR